MSKHIVLIIKNLSGRGGGAERIYCELASILLDLGYRVTCLHYDKSADPFAFAIDNRAEVVNLYPLYDRTNFRPTVRSLIPASLIRDKIEWKLENEFFVRQLRLYFKNACPDCAVSLLPPANTPTLVAASASPIKVVTCNHSLPSADYTSTDKWSQNSVDKKLRLKLLDRSDAIHVLFPAFKDWFPTHVQHKVVAIPNYISPTLRPDEGIQSERLPIVLAAGRIAPSKNYKTLIDAWELVVSDYPAWQLKIFGTGPQRKELLSYVSAKQLEPYCQLPGHKSDLENEYLSSSVFAHPSLVEGFGLAPAEALYFGLPVVALKTCSGVTEFVRHRTNGLLVDDSPLEIAGALKELIADAGLRAELSKNAPGSVKHFSLDEYKSNWSRLLQELLN